jgi:RNA polymerase sigma-70 factor (ECF subfamily)
MLFAVYRMAMTMPHPRPEPTDRELADAWARGEEAAATELVRRHAVAVGRYLHARGAGGGDIEDLVQETFIRAFRALPGWRGQGSLRGWLLRIAGNLRKDAFRKGGRHVVLTLVDTDVASPSDPAAEAEAGDLAERLVRALGGLPRLQREVFLLRAQQGLEYEEIAALLDTTPGAARVHYHHAARRLKGVVS